MLKRLLPLFVVCSLTAEGKGKVDPQTIPGTVKWLCRNFETELSSGRFKGCKDKALGVENAYHQCLEVLNSGLGQKRLSFSGVDAQKCVSAAQAYAHKPAKDSRAAMLASCSAAVRGNRGKDEACESPLDCAGGLACLGVKGASPGKCGKPLGEGESCDTDFLGGSAYVAVLQESRPACGPGLTCTAPMGKPLACSETAKATELSFGLSAGAECKDSGQCKGICIAGKCQAVCGSG